jgi:hypothetical protein
MCLQQVVCWTYALLGHEGTDSRARLGADERGCVPASATRQRSAIKDRLQNVGLGLDIACVFALNLDSVLFASVACMWEQRTDAGAYISHLL